MWSLYSLGQQAHREPVPGQSIYIPNCFIFEVVMGYCYMLLNISLHSTILAYQHFYDILY